MKTTKKGSDKAEVATEEVVDQLVQEDVSRQSVLPYEPEIDPRMVGAESLQMTPESVQTDGVMHGVVFDNFSLLTYESQLRALVEGLRLDDIEDLMKITDVQVFRTIGEVFRRAADYYQKNIQ